MKKRYISIFLSIILILLLFSGCKGTSKEVGEQSNDRDNEIDDNGKEKTDDGKENDGKGETVDTDKGVKLPLVDTPTTLVIGGVDNFYAEAPLSSGLPIWKEIEQETNIVLEWDTPTDYNASMVTRLAAGADLPDIIRVPGGNPTIYGLEGLLLPLNDYIDEFGDNVKKVFEQYEHSRELLTSGDGQIYALAPIIKDSAQLNTTMEFIRKDWLDKLGLEEPDTVGDWYEMLVAFKERDPNENNEQDEVPYAGNIYALLSGAYGLRLRYSDQGFWAEDGRVTYQWADPKLKDLLETANKMHKEELYGNSAGHADERTVNNQIGALSGFPTKIVNDINYLHNAGHVNANLIPVKPPKGSAGERAMEAYGIVASASSHSITKDCKKPELAFKFMDYMWSEEGINYMAWGMEGKSYVVDNGELKFTDFVLNNPDGLGPTEALRTLGAWPTTPWVQQAGNYAQMISVMPGVVEKIERDVIPHLVEPFPSIFSTPAEEKRLGELMGDINGYRAEMVGKFLTGEESLDQFDEYLRTLKDKGLDEVLEIKQKQYDRVFK